MWRKGNPFALLVEMQIGAGTVESSMELPQKIKNGSAFWPSDSPSGNVSKGAQNTNSKDHKDPYVQCSITYNCQAMEAAQVSINRWVNKKKLLDIYAMEFYLAIKKKTILPFATAWMDLEDIMWSEISQPEKDKYHMISLICGI